jgi:protein-S-isoprenylcysteine O-methyltransferase Ste14
LPGTDGAGDARWGWVLVAAQFTLLGVLVLGPSGGIWRAAGWLPGLAQVLRVAGAMTIAVGALALGRGASVHPAPTSAAVLRTGGLYRFVRHPIYSGVLLLAAGITATNGGAGAVGAFLALILVLNTKARLEERLLRERFPGYADYARRTPRVVPFPPWR